MSEIPGYYLQLGIIEDLRFRFRQWQVYIKNFLLAVAEATGFDYCSFASVNVPGESYCIESENRPRLVQGNEPFFQSMANGLAGWVFRNGSPWCRPARTAACRPSRQQRKPSESRLSSACPSW